MNSILNALTVDVEDYFMASAFEPLVPKTRWDQLESRVVRNTQKVLGILNDEGVKGTFFTLGWVAEKYPDLIRAIHQQGHEVACHGFDHRLIYNQTREEFRADVRRAKRLLEDASGSPVVGYRAPSFSVVPETAWALDVLSEEGFAYDASLLPASHARGGMPNAPREPHAIGKLMEFPMSTLRVFGKDFPFSGGGYFRLFPYALVRRGIESCHRRGTPAITYLHPWEFDPEQPRLPGKWLDRFRHYVNLDKTEAKLRRLLKDYRFGTVSEALSLYNGRGPRESKAEQ